MKRTAFVFLILNFAFSNLFSQSVAHRRAETMKLGMNFSYLDNYWNGTKEKQFSDFLKSEEALKRESKFADIAKAGFKTVRVPICFSAWMELKQPYNWRDTKGLEIADSWVKAALASNLNVIVDLHHSEFDGSIPEAIKPERIVSLWLRIAERYKHTDPEKVFFELRNEPHDISAEAWRREASEIIKVVRKIAPKHTLIVGFHEWNGRKQMIESQPFEDSNIIYTFHYYDPFVFTHQGASWVGFGVQDLRNIPFPANGKENKTPDGSKGSWVEGNINAYAEDSKAEKMFADLKAAKDWSIKNKVPIFLGEFGSFGQFSTIEDRCRHAETVYSALGKLGIPNAWWEWDQGFTMFKPGTTSISECMQKAIDSYYTKK